VNSATYADKERFKFPLVNYYLETLVDKITGLKSVIKRALSAFDLITTEPAKNTDADKKSSWSVCKDPS